MNNRSHISIVKQNFNFNIFCKILALITVLFSSPISANTEVIKISSDPWEPWVFGTEGGAATDGIAVALSNELFQRIGLQTDIKVYPYKRCIDQMKNGERDILLMAKKTKEREKYMLFSNVAAIDPQLVYYSTDRFKKFEWDTWADFKGYTIGGVRGFNYGDLHAVEKDLELRIELTANDNQNIKKLLTGRIDFILLSKSTAKHYLKQNPQNRHKLKSASKPVDNAEFHFSLSKKGKAVKYLDKINETLDKMKADGSLNKITGL